MTHQGADLGASPAVDGSTAAVEAMPSKAGTLTAAGFVAIGTLLVAAALVPAVASGPTNPYAAAMLVVLGIGAIAGACAIEAYGLVRRYAPAPPSVLAALVACIPAIAPMLQPGGGDLTVPLVWVVLLAVATLLVRRSRAAWILAAVTALPVLGLLGLTATRDMSGR
jgi:hypothetical protein